MTRYPFAPDFRRQLAAYSLAVLCRLQAGQDAALEIDVVLELCAVGVQLEWLELS